MSTSVRPSLMIMTTAALGALLLAGCAAEPQATAPKPTVGTTDATAEPEQDDAVDLPAVPGYAVGEIPPIPLFQLPDLALLDQSSGHFAIEASQELENIPGVIASPARCDEGGSVISGSGATSFYGDGSASHVDGSESIDNNGDGSGSYNNGSISITNNGDGSGTYNNGSLSIANNGDGSGSYVDGSLSIDIHGDGSGSYVDGSESIEINSDGSGTYVNGSLSITNNGDGSGNYVDGAFSIDNDGQGTAIVDGVEVDADPLPPVAKLGSFPPIDALAPVESCGTTLTFEDGVLFDFDKSDVRDDAAATLAAVAEVLGKVDASGLVVSGHTDSIGDDDYNQDLSERRAAAVVAALEDLGVAAAMTAEGYGESRPVAANDVNGVDNPAGRQLNRRVEVFIPNAL